MDLVIGALVGAFMGLFAISASFKMQKDYQQDVNSKLQPMQSSIIDSLPIKVSAIGGALVGIGIGILLGSII